MNVSLSPPCHGKKSHPKQLGLTHHRPKVDPYSANAMQSRPSAGPVPTPLQTQPRPPNSMARPVAANGVPLPAGSVTQMEMQQGEGGFLGGEGERWVFFFQHQPPTTKMIVPPEKGSLQKESIYSLPTHHVLAEKLLLFWGK